MKNAKEFQCLECGKLLSFRQAERAQESGCPGCGGGDIDLHVPSPSTGVPGSRSGACSRRR